jgi:hypothetical protein
VTPWQESPESRRIDFAVFPQLAVGALHFCKSQSAIFSRFGIGIRKAPANLGFVDIAVRNGNSACRRRKAAFLIFIGPNGPMPPE